MANYKKDSGAYVNFPSSAASNEAKDSEEYGMDVAKAIEHEWFAKDGNSTRFYANKQRFHSLRLYAKGDQDIRRYKDEFSFNGDLSYLNLDWTPVPIVPKFVDIVVNGMSDRDFEIKAQAIDPSATVDRTRYVKKLKAEMDNIDELRSIQENFNLDLFENDQDKLPKSEEELQLHIELDYKQNVEIAIESIIEYEMKKNRYDNLKTRIDYDLVSIGIGGAKTSFTPTEGIKVEYLDPANLVYSDSESSYFDDCYYFGEVKRIHISEIQKAFPHLTEEQLGTLIKHSGQYYDYNNIPYNQQSGDAQMVDVLYFCYKTVNNEIYKIKETSTGGIKALKKDESFLPPKDKRTGFQRTASAYEVVYEGVKVLGAEIMLDWKLGKNMMRPNNHSPKVIMPFVIASPRQYKGKLYSLVRRMEKYADAIQLIHLKIQQAIQRMTPSGVYLDADGLVEIDLGNGTAYNPQEALNMYFQTGSVIGRSMTDQAGFNNGKVPIQELQGSAGIQLAPLFNAYEYNLQQIRNVTGLNEARDGSTPDAKALVGVQKLAAANSNTATRNILFASSYITETIAESISLRAKDVIEFAPTKENYIDAIGKHNVAIIDDLSNIHYNEFGIFLELGPDEEEKGYVEANIQQALSRDLIKPEDAIEVRRVKKPKYANQMLQIIRKKREEEEQARISQNIQEQADANAKSAQASEQAKAQAEQIKNQSKSQLAELQSKLDTQKQQVDVEDKIRLMNHEHQLGLETLRAQQEAATNMARERNSTELNKEGIRQSGSGQGPAKIKTPFESKGNDTVGNIDLGKFEPK